jgi:hypothetical protein
MMDILSPEGVLFKNKVSHAHAASHRPSGVKIGQEDTLFAGGEGRKTRQETGTMN